MVAHRLGKKLFASANEPKYFLTLKGLGHINALNESCAQQAVLNFISTPKTLLQNKK